MRGSGVKPSFISIQTICFLLRSVCASALQISIRIRTLFIAPLNASPVTIFLCIVDRIVGDEGVLVIW